MKKLILVVILLLGAVVLLRLRREIKEEPRPTSTASAPATTAPANKAAVEPGKAFNRLFPKDGDGFDVKFTQEKDGYAQADLLKGGKKMAQLSISDTNANPSARDKFNGVTKKLGGFPLAAVGSQGTAVLIANRYQVQVRSLDPAFSAAEREVWISKFNLGGLAQ